jgi:Flp pilus assembly protein TadB
VPAPADVVRFIARSSKRIAVSVVGGVFVVGGLAMLVLPGPGILVVAIGFAILGTEYAWAAIALERTKRMAEQAGRVTRDGALAAGRKANDAARAVGRKVQKPRR